MYVVADEQTPEERILVKGRAALFVLNVLGGGWKITQIFRLLPTFLLDLGYDFVAAIRYRVWGRYDACPLPRPEDRDRFLG